MASATDTASQGKSGADLGAYRRRLRFRCWHRGTREMDLILGGFADRHIDSLESADLDDLDRLLGVPDPDIYNWLSGREAPPAEERSRVLDLLMAAPAPASVKADGTDDGAA